MVGDDVAAADVFAIAVALVEPGAGFAPVWLGSVLLADLLDHAVDGRVVGDVRQGGLDELLAIVLHEGQRFHDCQRLSAVDGLAIVADAGRAPRQVGGQVGVAGCNHGPTIDEDLRADLLGNDLAVQRRRPAVRRGDARFEAQVGGVFSGASQAAPPQDGLVLDQVIEPGLADLRGGDLAREAVVGQCADEGESTGDVIIGDDQRHAQPLVHVAADLAQFGHNALITPALEGAAQIHADDLAQHSGVDAFEIIRWKCQIGWFPLIYKSSSPGWSVPVSQK